MNKVIQVRLDTYGTSSRVVAQLLLYHEDDNFGVAVQAGQVIVVEKHQGQWREVIKDDLGCVGGRLHRTLVEVGRELMRLQATARGVVQDLAEARMESSNHVSAN